MFHVSHSIRRICKLNSAVATHKAKEIMNSNFSYIFTGTFDELLSFQEEFHQKGLVSIIE